MKHSNTVKEISVFVDESGSFEADEGSSRFYFICLLFHDQDADISEHIHTLETHLSEIVHDSRHCVHVGPLIRREGEYANLQRDVRQSIFRRMMAFVRKADICYHCFKIDKHFSDGNSFLHDRLLQDMLSFLVRKAELLNEYKTLKVYYDNGQSQVKRLLDEAFRMFSSAVEFVPDVKPSKYRLFQAADLLCTIELIAAKLDSGVGLSNSENRFFGTDRDFKRNILKPLRRKLI